MIIPVLIQRVVPQRRRGCTAGSCCVFVTILIIAAIIGATRHSASRNSDSTDSSIDSWKVNDDNILTSGNDNKERGSKHHSTAQPGEGKIQLYGRHTTTSPRENPHRPTIHHSTIPPGEKTRYPFIRRSTTSPHIVHHTDPASEYSAQHAKDA